MKIFTALFIFLSFFSFSQGNPAMIEAKVEDVYSQYNLTGDGVIFAMLDRGIDYTHPAYLNEDGTTRIAYIFDMVDQTGANASNNPYGVGTIFSAEDINMALESGGAPLSTDRGGHGTATTGIAAGNGGGTANGEFKGAAYEATIIAVKLVLDAFPPFGGNAGQSGFFNPAYIPIALDFVNDKVSELGMPSVTLMNIGSIGGPTDGTSSICQAIDDFVEAGNVFVCGVGDDGGGINHAEGTLTEGQTIELELNKALTGNLRFELWYSEDDRFTTTIEVPGGTQYGPYSAPTNANGAIDHFPPNIFFYHRGANQEFYGATSNRRNIFIDFTGSTGTYKLILEGTSINADGSFHATLNPANIFASNGFTTFASPGTSINDYSACFKTISPSDYVIDNSWTDINGISRSITNQGNTGEIWLGSSEGPTQDGRLGTDFAVPGEVLIAPYSPDTYYAFFDFNLVENGNGFYGIQNAVSAAAPLTAGIIALMLEANPNLTNDDIKAILQNTATTDSQTGTTPNAVWGYGKVNALAAVESALDLLSISEHTSSNAVVYPNPANNKIRLNGINNIEGNLSIFNISGQLVKIVEDYQSNFEIDISELNSGVYMLQFKSATNKHTLKLVKS